MVIQTTMAVVVPTLIPIADRYQGTSTGTTISYVAVGLSLVGSLCLAIEKARKWAFLAHINMACVLQLEYEFIVFLDLTGKYEVREGDRRSHAAVAPAFLAACGSLHEYIGHECLKSSLAFLTKPYE